MNESSGENHRNVGATASERYLAELCNKSFFQYWSFPSVYSDEGYARNGGQGKEICDLLVVFENNVLIFSDKTCDFPKADKPEVSWNRWFRRAVLKSSNQVWGAESWLKRFPERIFLDKKCTNRLPVKLPGEGLRFHRIAVAHGASKKCREFFGGSGSLMIDSTLVGEDHIDLPKTGFPFRIGRIDAKKGFVHILDDHSLNVTLAILDTITDFVGYLSAREDLLTKHKVLAPGEEDLLARYLMHTNSKEEHHFGVDGDFDFLTISEGHWDEYIGGPGRAALQANEISYAWDELLNRFSKHILAGTQQHSSHPGKPYEMEIGLRRMAAESRFRRRILAKNFVELAMLGVGHDRATRVIAPTKPGQPLYVFLCVRPRIAWPNTKYRLIRRNLLAELCYAAKARFPDAREVIGVASEPAMSVGSSEDMIYIDVSAFTDEDIICAANRADGLKLLVNLKKRHQSSVEYPRPASLPRNLRSFPLKLGRNEPCLCGSGKKFKKCCMPQ